MIQELSEEQNARAKKNHVSEKRVNISISKDVFEEFSFQAKRNKRTLYSFANEALSVVAKISSEGGSASEIYKFWRSLSLMKTVDVFAFPSDLADEIIARLYSLDKHGIMRTFNEAGSRFGGFLKVFAEGIDELHKLVQDVSFILPLRQFNFTKKNDTIEIAVIGAGRRIESTECFFEFIKSILSSYGYVIVSSEIGIGTVLATAKSRVHSS